ncbi:MAG: alpha/beta hydrolase [Rubrivivax sp.]|nr:alpha/beta hydrolase [Rubrivivax sp.]
MTTDLVRAATAFDPQPRDDAPPSRQTLPLDAPIDCRLRSDPGQRYALYVPATARARGAMAPLMVAVHGISRNAGAHMRAFAPAARRAGCVLLVPRFSRSRFPDYQRFGRPHRLGEGGRADHALLNIVAEVRDLLSLAPTPLHLVGHSGGAQFVQRFVLAYPTLVNRYVLSAAGCYAWPETGRGFPFGLRRSKRFPDVCPDPCGMLARPCLVLVGDLDDRRSPSLRSGRRVDAQQGGSRLERARRYVAAIAEFARRLGAPPPLRLVEMPGCGHAFSQCVQRGDLVGHTLAHLFDEACPGV